MKVFKKVVTSFYHANETDKFEIIAENTDVSDVRSKHQLPNKIVKFCLLPVFPLVLSWPGLLELAPPTSM